MQVILRGLKQKLLVPHLFRPCVPYTAITLLSPTIALMTIATITIEQTVIDNSQLTINLATITGLDFIIITTVITETKETVVRAVIS